VALGSCVHFTGHQPEPEPYYEAMDVFALTSRSEGMPQTIMEAFAAGVSVVASRVHGIPEMIEDEQKKAEKGGRGKRRDKPAWSSG
jgi:glycosyltransferase involved in cell wall biosynthesis